MTAGSDALDPKTHPRGPTDAALIAGLTHHDESALRALVDAHGRFVYGKALQILRMPQLAEEVAQDTLLLLWWEPDRYVPARGSLGAFLVGVARYKAIDLVRREETLRSRESLLVKSAAAFEAPSADHGVDDAIVVREAISQLPVAKREAIFLAYYGGLTYQQVAQALDVPEGTVKTRIRDSLIKLRTILAPPKSA